jgi:formate hydrogenlyase transcriptional activator
MEGLRAHREAPAEISGLAHMERDHILHALEACNWVVGGRHGAANRLEMKRTSLVYRMKKLGITRPSSLSHKNAIAGLASHE